jgi:hypothetical protein
MNTLLPFIQDWFVTKRDYFLAFSNADSRLEGWFKAELIVLFNKLKEEGRLTNYERESNIISTKDGKRKQIDFLVELKSATHVCELKALCISQAAGTPRNLHFYFRDDHVGLIKDFKKLDELPQKNKWVLCFIYPAPGINEWNKAVSSLPTTLQHWHAITKPQDYSDDSFFISLWKG